MTSNILLPLLRGEDRDKHMIRGYRPCGKGFGKSRHSMPGGMVLYNMIVRLWSHTDLSLKSSFAM